MKKIRVAPEKDLRLAIKGHRLLIRPLDADNKSEIELLSVTRDADQQAQAFGTVLAVGDLCWKDLSYRKFTWAGPHYGIDYGNQPGMWEEHHGDQWCKVGDIVLYQRYSGARVPDPASGELRYDLVVVNDKDVLAVVDNLDEYKVAYEEAKNSAMAEARRVQEERIARL
jgi:co-chaperonin GroES (HSP10)